MNHFTPFHRQSQCKQTADMLAVFAVAALSVAIAFVWLLVTVAGR